MNPADGAAIEQQLDRGDGAVDMNLDVLRSQCKPEKQSNEANHGGGILPPSRKAISTDARLRV